MRLIHRGDCKNYRENSYLGIESGLKKYGYDGVELDIRLSRDGYWMIYHDESLLRLHGEDVLLRELNKDECPRDIIRLMDLRNINIKERKYINIEIKENMSEINDEEKLRLILEVKELEKYFGIIVSSYDWSYYNLMSENGIYFGHLLEYPDTVPKEYNICICDKKWYYSGMYMYVRNIGYYTLDEEEVIDNNFLIVDYK